jgi:hypothetical protein
MATFPLTCRLENFHGRSTLVSNLTTFQLRLRQSCLIYSFFRQGGSIIIPWASRRRFHAGQRVALRGRSTLSATAIAQTILSVTLVELLGGRFDRLGTMQKIKPDGRIFCRHAI